MENKYYPHLFQKGTVGGVVLKNRIVRNSMGTYLGNPDGTVTDRQIKAYAQAADGGAGLIFMDNAVPVPMVPAAYGQTRTNSSQVLPFLLKQ